MFIDEKLIGSFGIIDGTISFYIFAAAPFRSTNIWDILNKNDYLFPHELIKNLFLEGIIFDFSNIPPEKRFDLT